MTVSDPATLPKGVPDGAFEPLHLAARGRDAALTRALIEAGHDVNGRNRREPNGDGGNTPLWFAAQGAAPASIEVAAVLLDAGAEMNARCEYGSTALHLAVGWGHLELVKYLIGRGADAAILDDEGNTPLASAKAAHASMCDREVPAGMDAWFRSLAWTIRYLESSGEPSE